MHQRLLTVSSIALAAATACAGAWALGFGPVRAIATIGQPLDASVVVRLQPGETLSDNCVSAVVTSGDTPIPAGQVSASFLQPPGAEARVRVRTTARIDEPFVNLVVSIGCDTKIERQFTVFADPPPLAVALESSAAPALPSGQPFNPTPPAARDDRPADMLAGGTAPPPRSGGRKSTGSVQRPAEDKPATVVAVNRSRAAAVASEAAITAPPEGKAERAQAARISSGAVTRSEGVARLRLDSAVVAAAPSENPLVMANQQREAALAAAKIAADVAEAANSSAVEKITKMEAELASARKEVAEAKSALARVQAERAAAASAAAASTESDDGPFSGYSTWLAGACGALLLLSGALFWRLRRSDSERLQSWLKENSRLTRLSEFDTVAPVTEQFPDAVRSTMSPVPQDFAAAPAPAARPARPPVDEAESSQTLAPLPPLRDPGPTFTETQPSSTLELDQPSHSHDISIEELLDVEQQAEFFVVLGQDDAAIDLLTSHVMSSGGASPMPYLKLLEIYRRIGDQTSYERTRKRFNARFNGLAPEWGADPNGGRTLDEYPDVVRHLQGVWADPVDAMAELQTLMFRNDSNLLFELPAYRDIMMLFTLARDLHDSSDHDQAPVDVLLPLGSPAGLPVVPAGADTASHDPFGASGLRLVVDDAAGGVQATAGRR